MKNIKNKRVLLVGGAGFIGHNLALDFKAAGAEVSILDGLNVNNLLFLHSTDQNVPNRELYIKFVNYRLDLLRKAGIPLYVEDARNYHKVSHLFYKIKPQVVIVLAAVAHANKSNKNPYETFDHSLRTLENSLDASKGMAEHFVYFSSSMVYGHFPKGGVTEETPCNPLGVYGALKLSGEHMVKAYNQAFDLPYTIVRPSALYGQRCISRRVGQIFVENAVNGEDITVNGDGTDCLDFTYIKDLSHGIQCVINSKNSINQVFNLTYGEKRSIAQMSNIIEQHFPNVNIKYMPKDKLTPDRGTLIVDKARDMIGYNPQYPLEKGFVDYINWYKSMDLYGAKNKDLDLADVGQE